MIKLASITDHRRLWARAAQPSVNRRPAHGAPIGPRYVHDRRGCGHVAATCPRDGHIAGLDDRKLGRLVDRTHRELTDTKAHVPPLQQAVGESCGQDELLSLGRGRLSAPPGRPSVHRHHSLQDAQQGDRRIRPARCRRAHRRRPLRHPACRIAPRQSEMSASGPRADGVGARGEVRGTKGADERTRSTRCAGRRLNAAVGADLKELGYVV
jgi:hypothetical protein